MDKCLWISACGLGERLEDIERLIADDAESLVRLRELIVAGKGNPTGKNQYGNTNNVSISTDLFVDPEPASKKSIQGNVNSKTNNNNIIIRSDMFTTPEPASKKRMILARLTM